MTIRRIDDVVLLEDVCPVDDAEILIRELQTGAARIDWSTCTHLHTACVQVLLAAGLPMRGQPDNALLQRWVAPWLLADTAAIPQAVSADAEAAHMMEA